VKRAFNDQGVSTAGQVLSKTVKNACFQRGIDLCKAKKGKNILPKVTFKFKTVTRIGWAAISKGGRPVQTP
jgi:hypothetical protein